MWFQERFIIAFLIASDFDGGHSSSSPTCTFSNSDCNGQDIEKFSNASSVMTQAACCQLCANHAECKVSVLAVGWQRGQNQCMLKSGCSDPKPGMQDRVKCCSEPNNDSCKPPPPPPPAWFCNKSLTPTFCDSTLSPTTRVAALVSKMTLKEKISQIGANGAPGINRLGIAPYQWWGEALHGICQSPSVKFQDPTPVGTSFPEPILTGGTFDKTLFSKIGNIIGLEGRAMANVGNAGLTFWAPNINIVRDPRWGRLQETPGEDPFLTSTYAMAFVKGVQGNHSFWLQATSTCKHYASYNLDNWHGMDRYHFNAVVSKQDWADTYSQPFQACVVGANASGVMCSYNAMNGVPTCADSNLITALARDTWKFDGYMTGDCGAAADIWTSHHYGGSAAGAVSAAVKAGMDQDCGGFVAQHAMDAVKSCTNCTEGPLKESDIDAAVSRLFRLRLRLGYFDPPSVAPYGSASYKHLNYSSHFEVALEAAQKGIVLLDNHEDLLPLNKQKVKSIAVIGPNANNPGNMQGVDCHGVPPYLITPSMAFANYSKVNYVTGCAINSNDTSGFAAAVAAVQASDAVVLVMGIDPSIEYEMRDRTNLLLPGVQAELIETVVKAADNKPVILVIMSGGVIDFSDQLRSGVDAVVWVGYPGQSGGQALAEIVFGDISPSGRVPHTWYKNEDFADASPTMIDMFNMGMRPNITTKYPGRTYRFFQEQVLYPFGFGLSYSTFTYLEITATPHGVLSAATIDELLRTEGRYTGRALVTISVTVINNADGVASDHSVLFFAKGPTAGSNGDPVSSLVAFARTGVLQPAQSINLTVTLTAWELSLANTDGIQMGQSGEWRLVIGPLSQQNPQTSFQIA